MKKNNVLKFFVSIVLIFSFIIPAYAQYNEFGINSKVLDTQMIKVVTNDDISSVRGVARGRILSLAELQISNDGDGILGVYAETLCHIPVEKIYMTIYLDVWDEPTQDWIMINSYSYEWSASDYPNEDLTDVSVSFDITGLNKGRKYSLRGSHAAKGFDMGVELMQTETDGIILE